MTIKNHPEALLVDLRLAETRFRLAANPDYLEELVTSQPDGQTIIIDDIQKIPELLPLVHKLIEKKRGWKFILTGSSARKLKRLGVDLLGGRALKKVLHPFIASELGPQFNLEDALRFGLIPLRFGQENPFEHLKRILARKCRSWIGGSRGRFPGPTCREPARPVGHFVIVHPRRKSGRSGQG